MLRVYNALNKNRSSPERAAALSQLLSRASETNDMEGVGAGVLTEGIPEEEDEGEEGGGVRAHPLDTLDSTVTDSLHSALVSGLNDGMHMKLRPDVGSMASISRGCQDQQSDKEKIASWQEEEAEDREEVFKESSRKSEAVAAEGDVLDSASANMGTSCTQQQQNDYSEQSQGSMSREAIGTLGPGCEGYVVVNASSLGGDQDVAGKNKKVQQLGAKGAQGTALSRKQLQKLLHMKQSEMLLVKDTTTGQAALEALGEQMTAELTIAGAVELLKKGLVQGGAGSSSSTVADGAAAGEGQASESEASGSSSTEHEGGSSSKRQQQHGYRARCCIGGFSKGDLEVPGNGCTRGGDDKGAVKFELDQKTHKLLMWKEVVSGSSSSGGGSRVCEKQAVVGVRLPGGKWTAGGSVGLVTANGDVHPMELVGERDWGGLLVGLNAMLLLAETAEEEGLAGHGSGAQLEQVLGMLGEQRVQDMPWSAAVMGLEV
jgi:hypothetical protein